MYRRVPCCCGLSYSSNALARAAHLRGERHFLGAYWRDFAHQPNRNRWYRARFAPTKITDEDVSCLVRDAAALWHAARRAGTVSRKGR